MTTATNGTPLIFRKDLGTTLEEQTWNVPETTAVIPSEEQKYLFDPVYGEDNMI